MVAEITVIVKDSDKTYRQKFLNYSETDGQVNLTHECPVLVSYVEEAIRNFKGTPDDVSIKVSMEW